MLYLPKRSSKLEPLAEQTERNLLSLSVKNFKTLYKYFNDYFVKVPKST